MSLIIQTNVLKFVMCGLIAAVLSLSLAACETVPGSESSGTKPFVFGGEIDSDSPLVDQVKKALKNNAETTLLRVQVSVVGDVVILKGAVDNEGVAQAAEQVAGSVAGVRHVTNNLYAVN